MEATGEPRDIWFVSTYGRVIASTEESEGRLSALEVSGGRGTMAPLHVIAPTTSSSTTSRGS
jgi:hypothetical protein